MIKCCEGSEIDRVNQWDEDKSGPIVDNVSESIMESDRKQIMGPLWINNLDCGPMQCLENRIWFVELFD